MGYNKIKGFCVERNATKKVYQESMNMSTSVGSKIRNLIQEDNIRMINNLKKYITNIYEKDPNGKVGGALHICLDDLNLKDDDILWCLENTIPNIQDNYWHSQYYYCAMILLRLSYSKRVKVVKGYPYK